MLYAVTAFYQFTPLSEARVTELQAMLAQRGDALGLGGLILLATEGINATVSGTPEAIAALKTDLLTMFPGLKFKDAKSASVPFKRFTVSVRDEIVTAAMPGVFPQSQRNNHLSPTEWHEAIQDTENTVIIDTRNDYETKIGKFQNAIDPNLTVFSEFADYVDANPLPKDKKLLIYCTGGIRCEKAILTLQEQGYENVYQLDGGILGYFEAFPDGGSYDGECFVFDHRVAVNSLLEPSKNYGLCPFCGDPAGLKINCANCKKNGLVCENCANDAILKAACSKNCAHHLRRKQQTLASQNIA
jgi:UPF0176 protein